MVTPAELSSGGTITSMNAPVEALYRRTLPVFWLHTYSNASGPKVEDDSGYPFHRSPGGDERPPVRAGAGVEPEDAVAVPGGHVQVPVRAERQCPGQVQGGRRGFRCERPDERSGELSARPLVLHDRVRQSRLRSGRLTYMDPSGPNVIPRAPVCPAPSRVTNTSMNAPVCPLYRITVRRTTRR